MILHRERRPLAVGEPLARAVVEVHVRRLPPVAGDRRGLDREPVILRGDLDLARREVLHRMVRGVVAVLVLVAAADAGAPHALLAQSDYEDWQSAEEPPSLSAHV